MSAVPGEGPVSPVPGAGRAPVAEDPGILAANLQVGVRLFASAVAFVFVAFIFAFFYLQTVNSNDNWRPHNAHPAAGIGIALLVCVLGATAAFHFASRSLADGPRTPWLAGVSIALVLGLAFVVIQIVQYTTYSFGPQSGGYASVFVGWTAMFLVFWLGAVYWIETLLAQTLRHDPDPLESEVTDPGAVMGASAAACVVYLWLLAGVGLIAWILLYLVK